MAFFEVMSALSATFAIGIPTFMEKVMRPKYEERFSEFRKARREAFVDEFEKTLPKLKESKEEMTPETVETVESLFNEWGQVKADENTLTMLLKYRKYFFVGWLLSCAVSLFSSQYMDSILIVNPPVTLGQFSSAFFWIMLLASLWYGYKLFIFDEKLSKTKTRTTGESFGRVESIARTLATYHEAEQKVEEALTRLGFPYTKGALVGTESYVMEVDFAVPKGKAPKYVIEVKTRLLSLLSIRLKAVRYKALKSIIPLTTILVSDFSEANPTILKTAEESFDFLVDFQNLEKLKEIIKL